MSFVKEEMEKRDYSLQTITRSTHHYYELWDMHFRHKNGRMVHVPRIAFNQQIVDKVDEETVKQICNECDLEKDNHLNV